MEDPSLSHFLSSYKKPPTIPQTLTEKIFQRHALDLQPGKVVRSGDFITLAPHRCMTHDNSWPVALKFMEMGATQLHDPNQIVMTLDHDVQNKSETNLKKYRQIEEFARRQGVDFYPAGHGIGHQIMVEEGYAWPGSVAVASDSHSNMYGGLACLGTPVVRTGAADIWATGSTWFKVPPVAKVAFTGILPRGATGKDVIVALCGLFNADQVLNHAIEFTGSEASLRSISIDDRLAIANMTTEWGALSGLFPMDSLLQGYLRYRATEASMFRAAHLNGKSATTERLNHERLDALFDAPLAADQGARYARSLFLDLSTIAPCVSGPNSVKIATPVHELADQAIKIDKAYLVSCTNSRASDLAAAAKVFKDASTALGRPATVAPGVSMYIAAASAAEQATAEAEGDWQALLTAGATALPSGCGPCIGLGTGLLEEGEVGISASNRNFKGRMGSPAARAYLGSPEVVAASALHGVIAAPGWYQMPTAYNGVVAGEGDGISRRIVGVEEALEKLIGQADAVVGAAEKATGLSLGSSSSSNAISTVPEDDDSATTADVVPGFPAQVTGEILFCDADNINTDGIYPGKYTYQDNITRDTMAAVCMENYDAAFPTLARPGDVLVAGFNFGCGSSREQAATAILARDVPLVVAGSFGNIFLTNSINNALPALESPRLVQRLRDAFSARTHSDDTAGRSVTEPEGNAALGESLDSPPPGPVQSPPGQDGALKRLTRRTGWTLTWDVRRSVLTVDEGAGVRWEERVPEIPPNVQRIIAGGGLVKTRQSMFGGT